MIIRFTLSYYRGLVPLSHLSYFEYMVCNFRLTDNPTDRSKHSMHYIHVSAPLFLKIRLALYEKIYLAIANLPIIKLPCSEIN